MQTPTTQAIVDRWQDGVRERTADTLVVEEPLEIRLQGRPLAVVMRTPGHDRELAAGFLHTEGIVEPGDIASIAHCADADELHQDNVVEVRLGAGLRPRRSVQRNFYATSSCGVCGKASIDAIHVDTDPVGDGPPVSREAIWAMAGRLAGSQEVFAETGALHAAAVFSADGELQLLREDVGRHNAVDKVVGAALAAGDMPLDRHVLVVSGRCSFEIVQKALRARIPVIAGVSGASSLAVDLAVASNVTLVGFLRDRRMNVYAGAERLVE